MKYPDWLQPRAPSVAKLAWSGDKEALRLLAQSGGRVGGPARAAKLTAQQRRKISRMGNAALVAKYSPEEWSAIVKYSSTPEQRQAWARAAVQKRWEKRA